MPGMDGFDLVECIHRSPHTLNAVIMMLTSGEQRGDVERCRDLGVSAYLTKPVRRNELRTAIATALDGNERRKKESLSTRGSPRKDSAFEMLPILLVEDNEVNQRVALSVLDRAGYSVFVANDGIEALEALRTQFFGVVLMDVQMPNMGGFEATAAIRKMEQGTLKQKLPESS
jgi:two-component system, sensor histidine kinase and response regulator